MELWRVESEQDKRPEVLGTRNLLIALGLHVSAFLLFFIYALVMKFIPKHEEEIIPIDLTVVVVENLDGNEDEPPPLKPPEPEPPPPPPPPAPKEPPKPKEPDPPKELEKMVTNIVKKVEKEEKVEVKVEKVEKKPEKPKKTKEQLRQERLAEMRKSATTVKAKTVWTKPQPNGRTDKKTLSDAEIQKLLNMGYKPGRSTNLATSEEQLGYSLIKAAFESKWDKPPWTDTLKPMTIRVWFGGGGKIVRYQLEQSSGDPKADQSIKSAASRVGAVSALPSGFIEKYRSSGVPVRFTVKPQ